MTLTAVGSAPVAVLHGPAGDVGDDADLLLDATASSDPDSLPALQSLSYGWECRRADHPTPCFTSSEQGDQVRLALPPPLHWSSWVNANVVQRTRIQL